jgi:hypothetical protein
MSELPLTSNIVPRQVKESGGSDGSRSFTLLDSGNDKLLRRVLAHWGCPDPELKFIPPPIFKIVQDIIDHAGLYSPPTDTEMVHRISMYADGLHSLILYDNRMHPNLAQEGKLSPALVALLQRSLNIARSSLEAKSYVQGKSVTKPYINTFTTAFEEMVRTGIYAPCHPVMRTFPYFRQDYLAGMSQSRRTNKQSSAKAEAQRLLREQSQRMGATCNKYKTKQGALTPGLFTVFCGRCCVCEAVELMPRFESPVTAFKMFAHRAWRTDDHAVLNFHRDSGIWLDCM